MVLPEISLSPPPRSASSPIEESDSPMIEHGQEPKCLLTMPHSVLPPALPPHIQQVTSGGAAGSCGTWSTPWVWAACRGVWAGPRHSRTQKISRTSTTRTACTWQTPGRVRTRAVSENDLLIFWTRRSSVDLGSVCPQLRCQLVCQVGHVWQGLEWVQG